jgi:hypothetical protein
MTDDPFQAFWELSGCRTVGDPIHYARWGWNAAMQHHNGMELHDARAYIARLRATIEVRDRRIAALLAIQPAVVLIPPRADIQRIVDGRRYLAIERADDVLTHPLMTNPATGEFWRHGEE